MVHARAFYELRVVPWSVYTAVSFKVLIAVFDCSLAISIPYNVFIVIGLYGKCAKVYFYLVFKGCGSHVYV